MVLVLGIDEAGRGCVLGPLVIAGCLASEPSLEKMKQIGVKDSKLLSFQERSDLLHEIKKMAASSKAVTISPEEIDMKLNVMSLNDLEAIKIAEIINAFPEADKIVIDCPDANVLKFKGFLYRYLEDKNVHAKIIAEHKADLNHTVVGAASIIAKVNRDNDIEKIKHELKINVGSGYPADPVTVKFLDGHWDKYPGLFRQSWQTWKDMKAKKMQKNLFQFGK